MHVKTILATTALSLGLMTTAMADPVLLGGAELGTLAADGAFTSFVGPIAPAGSSFSTSFGFDLSADAGIEGAIWGASAPILAATISSVTLDGNAPDATPDAFSFTGLTAGHHTLTVNGQANGDFGGMAGGNVHTVSTLIPEPSTYAMLLAGLLVLGWPKLRFSRRAALRATGQR